jgi:quercetin dioxygenase-like cupin family protein
MTPVHRKLASAVLTFDLESEMGTIRSELADRHSRVARTLIKEGPLRLTLVGMRAGGALREHAAEGPITIHVVEGTIVLQAAGVEHTVKTGAIVALEGGVRHDVSTSTGGMFLLTLVMVE